MINCHQLRIGNIILVNNRMRKVSAISLNNQSSVSVESITNEEPETCSVEDIHPLLITDSILQQCNFIFHDYFRIWQLGSISFTGIEMELDRDYNIVNFLRRPLVKKIASLHQLQNIYFMVHGKELDFDVDTIGLKESMNSAFARN